MVDSVDFAHQTQRLQHGLQPSFFPIILDLTAASVGQEISINMNPCDSIWIPTYFDSSLGLNPAQTTAGQPTQPPSVSTLVSGPNYNRIINGSGSAPVGMNIFDVFKSGPGNFQQAATIFALRFNTTASPWLLWGLSNLLSTDFFGQSYASGQGDCMRSITGPIARLWAKKISPCIVNGISTPQNDRIVLMSSFGYNQTTSGVTCGSVDLTGETPLIPPSQSATALSSGGYQITTFNSIESAAQGLPQPGILR